MARSSFDHDPELVLKVTTSPFDFARLSFATTRERLQSKRPPRARRECFDRQERLRDYNRRSLWQLRIALNQAREDLYAKLNEAQGGSWLDVTFGPCLRWREEFIFTTTTVEQLAVGVLPTLRPVEQNHSYLVSSTVAENARYDVRRVGLARESELRRRRKNRTAVGTCSPEHAKSKSLVASHCQIDRKHPMWHPRTLS